MDLHDAYRAAVASAAVKTGNVMTLRVGDRLLHHCGCGYETDNIEVMAIHQVRVHEHPLRGEQVPRVGVVGVMFFDDEGRKVQFWEADDPSGPWTVCPDGLVRKRYAAVRYTPQ